MVSSWNHCGILRRARMASSGYQARQRQRQRQTKRMSLEWESTGARRADAFPHRIASNPAQSHLPTAGPCTRPRPRPGTTSCARAWTPCGRSTPLQTSASGKCRRRIPPPPCWASLQRPSRRRNWSGRGPLWPARASPCRSKTARCSRAPCPAPWHGRCKRLEVLGVVRFGMICFGMICFDETQKRQGKRRLSECIKCHVVQCDAMRCDAMWCE